MAVTEITNYCIKKKCSNVLVIDILQWKNTTNKVYFMKIQQEDNHNSIKTDKKYEQNIFLQYTIPELFISFPTL